MASNFRQRGLSEELSSKLLSEAEGASMRPQKFPGRGKRTYKALGFTGNNLRCSQRRGARGGAGGNRGGGRHQICQSLEGKGGGGGRGVRHASEFYAEYSKIAMKGHTQKSEIMIRLGFSEESLLAHEKWNKGEGKSGCRLRCRCHRTSPHSARIGEVAVVKKKKGGGIDLGSIFGNRPHGICQSIHCGGWGSRRNPK